MDLPQPRNPTPDLHAPHNAEEMDLMNQARVLYKNKRWNAYEFLPEGKHYHHSLVGKWNHSMPVLQQQHSYTLNYLFVAIQHQFFCSHNL